MKKPPRGCEIDLHLAVQTLQENAGALVMHPSPPHVDGFDLMRGQPPNCIEILFNDGKIVPDGVPEGGKRKVDLASQCTISSRDREHEVPVSHREPQSVGPWRHHSPVPRHQAEHVLLQQVEDRDPPLLFDFGRRRRQSGIIEFDRNETVRRTGRSHLGTSAQGHLPPVVARSPAEMAWACSPSARASVSVCAAIRAMAAASARITLVRFMKLSTDRPDENRAVPAVGNT